MTLYLWAPQGKDSYTLEISGKLQEYAILAMNCSNINILDLNFFGTTINFRNSNNIRVEDCNFLYPSYSKRMLRDLGNIDVTSISVRRNNDLANNVIINSRFEYADGPAITGHQEESLDKFPVPGVVDHNWVGVDKNKDIRTQLRDPDNLDFRPKADSEIIDARAFALYVGKTYYWRVDSVGETGVNRGDVWNFLVK